MSRVVLPRVVVSRGYGPQIFRRVRGWSVLCAALLVTASMVAEIPAVGAKAPEFSLATPTGSQVRLSSISAKGRVILVVLRGFPGYQCPYCQKQVHDFIDHAAEFAAKKSTVLLVYPGPAADLDQHAKEALASQANLPANIMLVVDPDYKMTNLYGLRWEAPHETAYPSTFLLDPGGKIVFEKVSRGHGDRMSSEDVLSRIGGE